jgi:hypothetical protein
MIKYSSVKSVPTNLGQNIFFLQDHFEVNEIEVSKLCTAELIKL